MADEREWTKRDRKDKELNQNWLEAAGKKGRAQITVPEDQREAYFRWFLFVTTGKDMFMDDSADSVEMRQRLRDGLSNGIADKAYYELWDKLSSEYGSKLTPELWKEKWVKKPTSSGTLAQWWAQTAGLIPEKEIVWERREDPFTAFTQASEDPRKNMLPFPIDRQFPWAAGVTAGGEDGLDFPDLVEPVEATEDEWQQIIKNALAQPSLAHLLDYLNGVYKKGYFSPDELAAVTNLRVWVSETLFPGSDFYRELEMQQYSNDFALANAIDELKEIIKAGGVLVNAEGKEIETFTNEQMRDLQYGYDKAQELAFAEKKLVSYLQAFAENPSGTLASGVSLGDELARLIENWERLTADHAQILQTSFADSINLRTLLRQLVPVFDAFTLNTGTGLQNQQAFYDELAPQVNPFEWYGLPSEQDYINHILYGPNGDEYLKTNEQLLERFAAIGLGPGDIASDQQKQFIYDYMLRNSRINLAIEQFPEHIFEVAESEKAREREWDDAMERLLESGTNQSDLNKFPEMWQERQQYIDGDINNSPILGAIRSATAARLGEEELDLERILKDFAQGAQDVPFERPPITDPTDTVREFLSGSGTLTGEGTRLREFLKGELGEIAFDTQEARQAWWKKMHPAPVRTFEDEQQRLAGKVTGLEDLLVRAGGVPYPTPSLTPSPDKASLDAYFSEQAMAGRRYQDFLNTSMTGTGYFAPPGPATKAKVAYEQALKEQAGLRKDQFPSPPEPFKGEDPFMKALREAPTKLRPKYFRQPGAGSVSRLTPSVRY